MLDSRVLKMCALSLLCSTLFTGLARADWSLTTADGTEQKRLTVNTWDVSDGLSATKPAGDLVKLDSRSVVLLSSSNPPPPAAGETPGTWRLRLRNNDLLLGLPAGISGQSLRFTAPELGAITVPLKDIQSLSHGKAGTPTTTGSDKDAVHFGNGDTMEGIIADVQSDKLQLATGAEAGTAATTDVALNLIDSIVFAGAAPARTIPPLSARLTFRSGMVLTVPFDGKADHFAWTINDLTLADPAGASHHVAAQQVASIEILGGRVVSLTDLDPASDEQVTFLGTAWPTMINKNVTGGPLVVGNLTAPRGLGVHAKSTLAYDLDGSFDTFKVEVGMDASAAPRGAADVSVILDGKVIYRHEALAAGPAVAPETLQLPIKGGHHLELHADPPKSLSGLDILGRVDWLAPTLVRP